MRDGTSLSPAISPQEVEAELEKILASPLFLRAPRHSRFLTFVVRQTLQGSAECIKEYSIGLDVFGLGTDNYDPSIDPRVRVEAGRLRSRLADYYKELGRHDPIQIHLPKGTYVPVFSRNGAEAPLAEAASDAELAPDAARIEEAIVRPRNKVWRRWPAAAAALVLASVVVGYFLSHRKAKFTDKDSIVLADVDNSTGDPVFDGTLKQALSVQIEQTPALALVPERKVNATLELMTHAPGAPLTAELTRQVCQRLGSTTMLAGSIARLGSEYVIGLKVVDCANGDVLAEALEQAASKETVLKALDAAAVSIRGKLGESLSSVQKYATPVEEATTPSLEALQAYTLGRKAQAERGETAALPFYKQAVALDPQFAMAHRAMAVVYGNLGETGQAAEAARKAYELRKKVSEREKFSIEATYHLYATGDLVTAARVHEAWQQTYPRDDVPYVNLGLIYALLGNWDRAVEEGREAMALDPNDEVNYSNLGYAYAGVNRLEDAEAVYKEAQKRKFEGESLLTNRYYLAFLKNDTAHMAQIAASVTGKPGAEDLLLATEANTAAWYGKLKDARELSRQAMDSAEQGGAKETAATYQAAAAVREAEWGNRQEARAEAIAALKLADNRDVREMAGLALARAGDSATAGKVAAEFENSFPSDTMIQRYWLPSIRAADALEHNEPSRAIELLEATSQIELSVDAPLAPPYLRGQAYLQLGDGKAAAIEFQKLISHAGLVVNFPWGALARLGVARAYALEAQTDPAARDKALTAYQDFLTLWKDADPDIPIYKQAKAEYAKLR